MKKEQIKSILSNYSELIELAKTKAKMISGLDTKYSIYQGICNIDFEDEKVYVECNDSTYGCYETSPFSFPIEWLSMEDSELVELVETERQRELTRIAEAKAEQLLRDSERKEKSQFELYQELKSKFENL